MKPYIKRFLEHEGLTEADQISCWCGCLRMAQDFHHWNIRGMGGRKTCIIDGKEYDINHPLNVIPLSRRCHKMAHSGELTKSMLWILRKARGRKMA